MRGTHCCRGERGPDLGIIPAYAGNTPAVRRRAPECRDHPRVCGEHEIAALAACPRLGSSPRMRGTPLKTFYDGRETRIIPAYAGNTSSAMLNSFSFRDHPRVCGEHQCPRGHISTSWGSSPRMRGTPASSTGNGDGTGIIPAYAGNTWRCARSGRTVRDHPRVCGEHMAFRADADQTTGSSPRMRGTLRTCGSSTATPRIIPAYAGNTQVHMAGRVPLWDHPRVCGEHVKIDSGILTSTGSSPRMRGTHVERSGRAGWRGIIPAYAGNTI